MTPEQTSFLDQAAHAADVAGHVWPQMAACEAALESAYGQSQLARKELNLFGCKQHRHPVYGTVVLPTREFENGEWETINSSFIAYPSWGACFKDRMVTLLRLQEEYPAYKAALNAPDAETYIVEVSKTWSSDPNRADKVRAIYAEYLPLDPTSPNTSSGTGGGDMPAI